MHASSLIRLLAFHPYHPLSLLLTIITLRLNISLTVPLLFHVMNLLIFSMIVVIMWLYLIIQLPLQDIQVERRSHQDIQVGRSIHLLLQMTTTLSPFIRDLVGYWYTSFFFNLKVLTGFYIPSTMIFYYLMASFSFGYPFTTQLDFGMVW